MKLWNWFLTLIGKRFPLPPRHILTYEEMRKYWESLGERRQRQCTLVVLRIRKVPMRGFPNIVRRVGPSMLPSSVEMLSVFGIQEHGEPFTIRIDREWEPVPGMKKKEEVCIANFEL